MASTEKRRRQLHARVRRQPQRSGHLRAVSEQGTDTALMAADGVGAPISSVPHVAEPTKPPPRRDNSKESALKPSAQTNASIESAVIGVQLNAIMLARRIDAG